MYENRNNSRFCEQIEGARTARLFAAADAPAKFLWLCLWWLLLLLLFLCVVVALVVMVVVQLLSRYEELKEVQVAQIIIIATRKAGDELALEPSPGRHSFPRVAAVATAQAQLIVQEVPNPQRWFW